MIIKPFIPEISDPKFDPLIVLEYLKDRFVANTWYTPGVFFHFISYYMDEMELQRHTKLFLLKYWRRAGEIRRLRTFDPLEPNIYVIHKYKFKYQEDTI